MNILHNYDISQINTLHLKSLAANYFILHEEKQLYQLPQMIKSSKKYFILGGGSNIIVPEVYDGLVIHNKLLGKTIIDNGDTYIVSANSGEIWDDFVAWTIDNGAYGLENLSLIPGTVGASPVQNIGAYGVEVKDFIDHITIFDLDNNNIIKLTNRECEFSYRNSILKSKTNYIVINVSFKLPKTSPMNCNYGDLKAQLALYENPTVHDLRDCIIKIRSSKLPDPKILGNVGSFFHNPIINQTKVENLKHIYPNLPIYSTNDPNNFKVSAGWLIDNLGLKGYRMGNVGVYEKQALVLVNYDQASKDELINLATHIQALVLEKYDICINIEPIQV